DELESGGEAEPEVEETEEQATEPENKENETDAELEDPALAAFQALQEADPDTAQLILDQLEAKEKAEVDAAELEAKTKVEKAGEPVKPPAPQEDDFTEAEQIADYNAQVRSAAQEARKIEAEYETVRQSYSRILQKIESAKTKAKEAEDDDVAQGWNEQAALLTEMAQEKYQAALTVHQKLSEVDQKSQLYSSIKDEIDEYPPFAKARATYIELRTSGKLNGTEPVRQRMQVINEQLMRQGRKTVTGQAKPSEKGRAGLERYRKLKLSLGQRAQKRNVGGNNKGGPKPSAELLAMLNE
ncbi:MAG: hypothetical protein KKF27_20560, partial [Gammaproteobacteria bacterium]|nr:hypothetical protein [Gammaproteobacteria bacterium]